MRTLFLTILTSLSLTRLALAATITANPSTITNGQSTVVTWTCTSTIKTNGGTPVTKMTSRSETYQPTLTTTYVADCLGESLASVAVTVNPVGTPTITSFTLTKQSGYGMIAWTTANFSANSICRLVYPDGHSPSLGLTGVGIQVFQAGSYYLNCYDYTKSAGDLKGPVTLTLP